MPDLESEECVYIYIHIYIERERERERPGPCQSAFGSNLAKVKQSKTSKMHIGRFVPKRISLNNRISICISLGISVGICIGLVFELVSTFL